MKNVALTHSELQKVPRCDGPTSRSLLICVISAQSVFSVFRPFRPCRFTTGGVSGRIANSQSTDKQPHYPVTGTNPTGCRCATPSSLSSNVGASSLYSTGVTNRAISVLDTKPPMITHASGEYSPDP